jgi:hypothetical protein
MHGSESRSHKLDRILGSRNFRLPQLNVFYEDMDFVDMLRLFKSYMFH